MSQAKHTNKNADHLEAEEAVDEDSVAAAMAAEEIDEAAEDTAVAAVMVAVVIEAIVAVAAVTGQDIKLSTIS